jgi:metal-dependent hydrolase (beta-lactamase superfamily II)
VADGTRTHDHLDHNQGLYQLSYSHRADRRIAAVREAALPAKSAQHILRLNQGLYQLSYSHRARRQDSRPRPDFPVTQG